MRRAVLVPTLLVAGQALVACTLVTDLSGLSQPGAGGASGSTGAESSTGPAGGLGGSTSATSTGPGGGAGGGVCAGKPGPPMVDLDKYCIDSTEVTRADYSDFLAADVPTQNLTGTPSYCAWNTTYAPASGPADADDFPVMNVDWCDAYAYCAWAGKRLCGRIGGGASAYTEYEDATVSQWYSACSIGGVVAYPYGPYDPSKCAGSDQDGVPGVQMSDTVEIVKSATECHGASSPYDQIYDMSGNVSEWEDSCDGMTGANDLCRRRGGAYIHEGPDIRCGDDSYSNRQSTSSTNGFRCCAG